MCSLIEELQAQQQILEQFATAKLERDIFQEFSKQPDRKNQAQRPNDNILKQYIELFAAQAKLGRLGSMQPQADPFKRSLYETAYQLSCKAG